MQIEAAITFLALCAITLWFNRWVVREEIKAFRSSAEAEILKERVRIVEELYDLELQKAKMAEVELSEARRKKVQSVSADALPFFTRTDEDEARLEDQMKVLNKREEYFDEVAGLGR